MDAGWMAVLSVVGILGLHIGVLTLAIRRRWVETIPGRLKRLTKALTTEDAPLEELTKLYSPKGGRSLIQSKGIHLLVGLHGASIIAALVLGSSILNSPDYEANLILYRFVCLAIFGVSFAVSLSRFTIAPQTVDRNTGKVIDAEANIVERLRIRVLEELAQKRPEAFQQIAADALALETESIARIFNKYYGLLEGEQKQILLMNSFAKSPAKGGFLDVEQLKKSIKGSSLTVDEWQKQVGKHGAPYLQRAAILALLEMNPEYLRPRLTEIAELASYSILRIVLQAIVQLQHKEAAHVLYQRQRHDVADMEIILPALTGIGITSIKKELLSDLAEVKDNRTLKLYSDSVAAYGTEVLPELLVRFQQTEPGDSMTRIALLRTIALIKDPVTLAFAESLLSDPDDHIRRIAHELVNYLQAEDKVPSLAEQLMDPDPKLATRALDKLEFILEHLLDTRPAKALGYYAEREDATKPQKAINLLRTLAATQNARTAFLSGTERQVFCTRTLSRAVLLTVEVKGEGMFEFLGSRGECDSRYLVMDIQQVIGTIGDPQAVDGNARPDGQGGLYIPLWLPATRSARYVEIDRLEIFQGADIDYDWAVSAVINQLLNSGLRGLPIILPPGLPVSGNTRKLVSQLEMPLDKA